MAGSKATSSPTEKAAEVTFTAPQPGFFNPEAMAELEKALDTSRVKKKPGQGNFDYIPHADIRRTANRIFGFDGWGYTTNDVTIVTQTPLVKGDKEGVQACAIATVTLKVRLADGTWMTKGGVGEGTGNGYGPTAPVEAPGKAAKEAESDALKRAFINLGDQFGLILYAKDEERAQLQAEAEAATVNAVAVDDETSKKLSALASEKGQSEAVAEQIAKDVEEFGHLRQARAEALIARLEQLDAGDAKPEAKADEKADEPKAEESKKDAIMFASEQPSNLSEEQKKLAAEWKKADDEPATAQEISSVMLTAEKINSDLGTKTITAVVEHREKNHGLVSKAWLRKLSDRVMELAKTDDAGADGDLVAAGDPSQVEGERQKLAEEATAEALGRAA